MPNRPFPRLSSRDGQRDRRSVRHIDFHGPAIELANASFVSGLLRIGAENIAIKTLSATQTRRFRPWLSRRRRPAAIFSPVFSVVGQPGVRPARHRLHPSFNGFRPS